EKLAERRGRARLTFFPNVQPELLALLVEVRPLEVEAPGGGGDVRACRAQALADDLPLEGVHEVAQSAFGRDRPWPRGGGGRQCEADLVGRDGIALAEDERALDDVAQLADV